MKPEISCNTKEMYSLIDKINKRNKSDSSNVVIKGLQQSNVELIANNLYNTFEEVQLDSNTIQDLKREFLKNNAIGSLMTGSGSCVYGIFKDKQMARKAYRKLKDKYETYICTSYNSKRSEKLD